MIEVHGLILFNAFSKILSKIHFMGIACTFFWGWCEQMEGQRTRKRKKDWLHTSWVFRCLLIVHRSWDYISWPYAAKNPFALTFSNTMKERWWWWLTETPWQKSWRSRSIWRCLGRCLRGDVWSIGKPWLSAMPVILTSPHAGLYLGRPFSASSPGSTLWGVQKTMWDANAANARNTVYIWIWVNTY